MLRMPFTSGGISCSAPAPRHLSFRPLLPLGPHVRLHVNVWCYWHAAGYAGEVLRGEDPQDPSAEEVQGEAEEDRRQPAGVQGPGASSIVIVIPVIADASAGAPQHGHHVVSGE